MNHGGSCFRWIKHILSLVFLFFFFFSSKDPEPNTNEQVKDALLPVLWASGVVIILMF